MTEQEVEQKIARLEVIAKKNRKNSIINMLLVVFIALMVLFNYVSNRELKNDTERYLIELEMKDH